MKLKVSGCTLMTGPMMMASGSGGGSPGGPPKPKAPIAPKPPKKSLWQRIKDWFTETVGPWK